jgi:predicted phage terminase large subunit-like protein
MQNGIAFDIELRRELLSDLFTFHRFMFEKRTGREFMLSRPDGNESHFKTICRELENTFHLKTRRLAMNLPPGWAKSELCKSFITWCFGHYPDCKFLYISHSFELAALHTASIKQTMCMPIYRNLFGIDIRRDSSAKDAFMTTANGAVYAFGSQGGIVGYDAGLPGLDRFSGGVMIDDIHKPDDIHSDTIRERVKRNYFETIERRPRAPNVPIVLFGQRLHEDDIFAHLFSGADGQEWRKVIIKGLDDSGNARYPEVNPKSQLLMMREKQPYVYASQYQQDPMPAGGGLFQESWFPLLDQTPDIIATFVTCDSAETEQEYNDATVFSFWGLYPISFNGVSVDELYGLHWIDCREMRVEPKDLQTEFLDFWTACMRYRIKPKFAAIEKKSTGVTLVSTLKNIPGLRIIDIERAGAKNNKTTRFISMQEFIANGQISLPVQGKHTMIVREHMRKITANNVHKFDDICDTAYDAIKMALIDKIIIAKHLDKNYQSVAKNLMSGYNQADRLRSKAYGI